MASQGSSGGPSESEHSPGAAEAPGHAARRVAGDEARAAASRSFWEPHGRSPWAQQTLLAANLKSSPAGQLPVPTASASPAPAGTRPGSEGYGRAAPAEPKGAWPSSECACAFCARSRRRSGRGKGLSPAYLFQSLPCAPSYLFPRLIHVASLPPGQLSTSCSG